MSIYRTLIDPSGALWEVLPGQVDALRAAGWTDAPAAAGAAAQPLRQAPPLPGGDISPPVPRKTRKSYAPRKGVIGTPRRDETQSD